MGTPVNIIVGSQVWIEDPDDAWIDGEVTEIKGSNATVATTNGKMTVASISSIYPKDTEAPPSGVDDMTKLAYLHEPGVLNNLARRYPLNEIYTYTGNILIAVNPFRRLSHLYDTHMMQQYKGAPFGELSPHPFAVADASYRALINEHGNQSILVSGESGAGKTETTKMLMRYLAFMGGRSGTEGRTVEQQVLESNPVLEAFGNAKTVKNNNSSRFGKFVEIQFDKHAKISGAAVRTYLLERSRVCQVSDPERNYHCFYMLCAAPPEDVKRFKLGNPKTFHYLNQSSCYEVANVDDAREYLETRNAMDVVGIGQEEQEAIFRVVAAILHLGNINFMKGKEADSSKLKDEKSLFHLRTAAELFMCDEKALEDSLCKRVIVTPDGNITKLLDPAAATTSRDALAKTVYSRLFDWLVDKINNSIGQDPEAKSIIGVLDIYGFESFKINSFEQFCINLTNEKLQQHFNQHIFKMEQDDYTTEDINWSYVEFVDNQDVLDLIEKKPGGIIALLDEACMFPKATHETFAQKMYQTYRAHKRFSKPKLARTDFTINHYAGDVTYQADHFLDKNKDYVIAEFQALLMDSKCSFVANLFPPLPEESSKQSKFSSIGTQFKQQLQSLMEILSTTEPHYIRCVQPNTVLKPGIFENMNVLNQLRCGGVLEAIRISCAGYPTKRTFDEFLDRFGTLAPDVLDGCDEKSACIAICDRMGLKGYQIGKTKVFLRARQMAELDARRTEVLAHAAKRIQRQIRTYLTRKEFIALKRATIHFQKLWRAQLARVLYEQMKREAASIHIQFHSARKSCKELQAAAVVIQTEIRAMAARNEYRQRRRNKAAKIVQISSTASSGSLACFYTSGTSIHPDTTQMATETELAKQSVLINNIPKNSVDSVMRVLVIRSGSIKKSRHEGTFQTIILVDEEGTKIQATLFNKHIETWKDSLKPNKSYYIAKGCLHRVNPNYSSVHKEVELAFTDNTIIKETEHAVSTHKYYDGFLSLEHADKFPNGTALDLICVLVSVNPLIRNEKSKRRKIVVTNQLKKHKTVTLWGDFAENDGAVLEKLQDDKPILALCDVIVSIYKGQFGISTIPVSSILINPMFQKANDLRACTAA